MCKYLKLHKSAVFYTTKGNARIDYELITGHIIEIFEDSKKRYGSRKIKEGLRRRGFKVSRKVIRKIMKEKFLISKYTQKQFKVHSSKNNVNNDEIENKVDREFYATDKEEILFTDLTYVRVNDSWYYICLIGDMFNREIVGYSCGPNKDSKLVMRALSSIKFSLRNVKLFHTDRGSEFKNKEIDDLLDTFNIDRSLSDKGCPFDNAVAESLYSILKTEFADEPFESLSQLESELFEYVHWYNHKRYHSTLGYLTPMEFKARYA